MTYTDEELANISISVNQKGQFVFNITGDNEAAQKLAYSIVAYARESLNKDPKSKNKLVFVNEDLDLLH